MKTFASDLYHRARGAFKERTGHDLRLQEAARKAAQSSSIAGPTTSMVGQLTKCQAVGVTLVFAQQSGFASRGSLGPGKNSVGIFTSKMYLRGEMIPVEKSGTRSPRLTS